MRTPHSRVAVLAALLLLAPLSARAQGLSSTVEVRFGERSVSVATEGSRIALLPVMELIGAEASFSPSAGTYGVLREGRLVQLSPGRRHVLIEGVLQEMDEAPVASADGVMASRAFLERVLLAPFGFHLEAGAGGFVIVPGRRFADEVTVRATAADFGATTTLVLSFGREVRVDLRQVGQEVIVGVIDGTPAIDSSMPMRSRRVVSLGSRGQEIVVRVPADVGLLSWHSLSDPPRVVMDLGAARPTPTPAPVAAPVRAEARAAVVIDPGHGGDDTGAVGPSSLQEKDLVLAIARRLQSILESRGLVTRLTRTGDDGRALSDRTALANRLEARAFVSLHANASPVGSVRGAETYYMSLDEHATDAAAAATADVENRPHVSGERSALDLILWDLAQADVLNESARLALAVQGRLNTLLGLRDRGVKQAPFVVLTGATMPAVLVEVGFLSNAEEAGRLADPAHQQQLAEAIASGIEEFLGGR